MRRFLEWIKKLFAAASEPVTPEPKPAPVPAPEYVFGVDPYVEREVASSGTFEAEVYVPEEGRATDWGTAEILAIVSGTYHAKTGTVLYSIHPYKVKHCVGPACKEPRFNLKWGQWRKLACSWTPTRFVVTIDGVAVEVGSTATWAAPIRMIYGGHPAGHLLAGAKMRGMKWGA